MRRLMIAGVLAFAVAAKADAQLNGAMFHLQYEFPSMGSSIHDGGYKVIGPGAEWSVIHGNFTVDMDDTGFSLFWIGCGPGCSYTATSFNGIRLQDSFNMVGDFTAVTFTGGTQNVTQSMVTFDQNNIWLNFSGMAINENATARFEIFDAAPGVVPEPATVTLMASGLLVIAGVAARRRRRA